MIHATKSLLINENDSWYRIFHSGSYENLIGRIIVQKTGITKLQIAFMVYYGHSIFEIDRKIHV